MTRAYATPFPCHRSVRFVALKTSLVRKLQAGGEDANGQTPERHVSCARVFRAGIAWSLSRKARPISFSRTPLPGAAALGGAGSDLVSHAKAGPRHPESGALPGMLVSPSYLIRGYGGDDRIVYGSGRIVPTAHLVAAAERLFADSGIAYIHVRSAANNCFQCRLERAS